MPLILTAPSEYPFILMGICANYFLFQLLNPLLGRAARVEAFPKEFMDQFQEEHEKAFPGSKVDEIGLPDQGTGWYSSKLSLAAWVKFNSTQRVLLNYVEHMPLLTVTPILSGFYFPLPALVGIWGYFLGRIIYVVGYRKSPNMRKPGVMLFLLCTMMMMFLGIASCAMFVNTTLKTMK